MRASLAAGFGAAALALGVVALSVGIGSAPAGSGGDPAVRARTDEHSGRAVFARMGCGSCHTLAAASAFGSIGPNLDARLARHTRESLVARITASSAPAEGFTVMPTDFGSRMNARELDALVRFLLASRGEPRSPAQ